MRSAAIPFVAVLYILGPPTAGAQDVLNLQTALDEPPVWVSGKHALRGEGFDWSLFRPGDREDLKRDLEGLARAEPPGADGCSLSISYGVVARSPSSPANHSLEDLISAYDKALLGEVESIEPGFYRGILGSLVRVRHSQSLEDRAAAVGVSYLFLETGRVQVAGKTLCKKGPRGQLPEPGARLLFFYDGPLSHQRENPVIFLEDEVFFFSADGRTSLPGSMARRLPSNFRITFDDFLTKVETLTNRSDGEL